MFDPATLLVYSTNDNIDQATIDAKGEYGMSYNQFRSKVSEKKTLWAPLNVNDFQTTFRTMHAILFSYLGIVLRQVRSPPGPTTLRLTEPATNIDIFCATAHHC